MGDGAEPEGGKPRDRKLLRAKTCFFFYCDEARKRARRDHPELSMAEISKLISKEWRAMTPDEKRPFKERAKKHKSEFDAQKVTPFASESSKKLPPGWKRQIDSSTGVPCYVHGPSKTIEWYRPTAATAVPFVPKKAKTAYNFFAVRMKEACKLTKERAPDLCAIAGQWRLADEMERAECTRLANLDKTRYEAETRAGRALPDLAVDPAAPPQATAAAA